MRRPSRTMPPSPGSKPLTWLGCLLLALLAFGIVTLICYQPLICIVPVVLSLAMLMGNKQRDDELAGLAVERSGESICTFARSFDYRRGDTWIIRAVFEELQPYCTFRRQVLPLRRSDELEAMLGIDDEELEALVEDMAFRAGRSLADYAENPFLGRIRTVADLVDFLMHQPVAQLAH